MRQNSAVHERTIAELLEAVVPGTGYRELAEEKRQIEQEQIEWRKKIKRWREWLAKGDKSAEAEHGLSTIEDPMAVKAIDDVLDKEKSDKVRTMLVESLGRIGSNRAVTLLIDRTVNDDEEDVRLSALDELEKHRSPDVTAALVSYLKHKDNAIVNRAAKVLGRVGDPTAVRPLIDGSRSSMRVRLMRARRFRRASSRPSSRDFLMVEPPKSPRKPRSIRRRR